MQDSEVTTTTSSGAEGRLKVSTGVCSHGKKGKCLKCVLRKNKKDGAGGPGIPKLRFPTGIAGTGSLTVKGAAIPKSPSRIPPKARKIKGVSLKSLKKKMVFSKSIKKTTKIKRLKSLLKRRSFKRR